MSDDASTPRRAQRTLLRTAAELRAIDDRLAALAESITPSLGRLLPSELRGGAQCVRDDLLQDAIGTLEALGHATEDSVRQRRRELDDAAGLIAAFG